jgi:hypothetical protein
MYQLLGYFHSLPILTISVPNTHFNVMLPFIFSTFQAYVSQWILKFCTHSLSLRTIDACPTHVSLLALFSSNNQVT